MANSKVQLKVEKWIRDIALKGQYGCEFRADHLEIETKGVFNFDAVRADHSIVANISTSSALKKGAGKFHKIRSDMLFLLMVKAEKRLIVLTEKDMFDFWEAEKKIGRVPEEISFVHISLPESMVQELVEARKTASQEVTPAKHLSKDANRDY